MEVLNRIMLTLGYAFTCTIATILCVLLIEAIRTFLSVKQRDLEIMNDKYKESQERVIELQERIDSMTENQRWE